MGRFRDSTAGRKAAQGLRKHATAWARKHTTAVVIGRVIWWLLRHPLHSLGIALVVFAVARGWGLFTAVLFGGLPLIARYSYRGYRKIRLLSGSRNLGESVTLLSRRRNLLKHWRQAALNAKLTDKQNPERIPRLTNVVSNASGVTATIACGTVGIHADTVVKSADTIAASIPGCRQVTVTPGVTPGFANLHVMWDDPLKDTVDLSELPLAPKGRLAFGVTEDGQPATIARQKSLLIVGQSGSGKSTIMWGLLASTFANRVPIRLHVIDPAGGVELHHLRNSPYVASYADRPADALKVIKGAKAVMDQRLERMGDDRVRLHVPTAEEPWDIVIIDELLLMSELFKNGTRSPLGEILAVGRKAAVTVWALTQIPQIDTIGRVRNLFVQKLVLSTESRSMTEAVLGDGAEAAGAKCSRIPESVPGTGYAHIEGIPGYPRFRAVWVPDEATELIAHGHLPSTVPVLGDDGTETHVLYGWYSGTGQLLYVGISNNSMRRTLQHVKGKYWANDPGVTMRVLEQFHSRDAALRAEKETIQRLRPVHNIQHAAA